MLRIPRIHFFGLVFSALLISAVHAMPVQNTPRPQDLPKLIIPDARPIRPADHKNNPDHLGAFGLADAPKPPHGAEAHAGPSSSSRQGLDADASAPPAAVLDVGYPTGQFWFHSLTLTTRAPKLELPGWIDFRILRTFMLFMSTLPPFLLKKSEEVWNT